MREYPVNPNVFNGGAVVFNSTPFVNFFLQQQAKKEAKEDSLNKYYQDQMKAVTPTGMRSKDIEGGWAKKAQQWQNFGVQNKKYLANPALDGYKTINEFNRLKNELLSETEKSKEYGKYESTIATAKLSGKLNPSDSDMEVLNDIGLSIYDANKKNRTLAELSINRPPFDANKFLTDVAGTRKRSTQIIETRPDAQKGLLYEKTADVYTPEEMKAIAENAPFVAEKDPSAKSSFERMLESDTKLPPLQEAYSRFYPGDIVDTPEKVAKAYAIMGLNQPTGFKESTKPYTDPNAAFQRQKELIDYRGRVQKSVNAARGASTVKEATGAIDGIVSGLIGEAKSNPIPMVDKGKQIMSYNLPLTEEVLRAGMLPTEGKNGEPAPNALRYIEKDGKPYIRRIVYIPKYKTEDGKQYQDGWKLKDGKPYVDQAKSTYIPLKQFKEKLAKEYFTGKALYGELGDIQNSDEIVFEDNDVSGDERIERPSRPSKPVTPTKGMFD